MTGAGGIKCAFSVAWVLSGASLLMISDDYPGGYERMAGYAAVLFVAGVLVGIGGLLAGTVSRRRKASALGGIGGRGLYFSGVVFRFLVGFFVGRAR